ncbi:ATP-binding protein [Frankia sp. CNm7]|uniref:ATP-binding protein n=1 Tax=Frankia nepalensis TaxID=1836974 RepID=A0A937UR61_9ACTN|nr:AAA family ATPase [Frankia nepalensis]MBL7499931.1 ATP-binding protein [Frankia nepalensis]MBL7511706.1 ATP-binding protein [Frankia nepalensis]MBL7523033.1 ATP-binding protein [Frankia nepalensis]MBL7632534.1 ATP-binding protein [Frankia nepalensis]
MREDFVGRAEEMARLESQLAAVREGRGRLVSVRGRRQAGKSRLISEFVRRTGLPQLFVTGARQATLQRDLDRFVEDARLDCTLPGADGLTAGGFTSWEQALRATFAALPADAPAIVVIDEFPWLLARDPGIDGTLQKLWDRLFESRPVLMFLIGSDLAVMELLTSHQRPLFGRAREMVVEPFSIGDTARMLAIGPDRASDAFDAQLITGGYPRLLLEWRRSGDMTRFLNDQLADENSELVVTGQRVLDAEFPADLQAGQVLRAVGAGDRAFSAIAARAGIAATPLTRALALLTEKRVIAADLPTSVKIGNLSRYRVADPYLRFWLRFIEDAVSDIQRGRPDLARTRVTGGWIKYRGRAVEPLVRLALARLATDDPVLGGAETVGGWWPRNNTPEIDLVGVRSVGGGVNAVTFVGSIKWRDNEPFTQRDLDYLLRDRAAVPGGEFAPPIAVTRTTTEAVGLATYDPARLLGAW